VTVPFETVPEWTVLVDVGYPAAVDPQDAIETLFMAASTAGLVTDGVVAQSQAQRTALWKIRESIPEANRRTGSISSHDISVPLGAIPEFIRNAGERLAQLGDFRVNCFGHMGDGNLHYNVFAQQGKTPADHVADRPRVKRLVHDLAHAMGGSVSAEHGIGRLKVDDMVRYGDPVKLDMMRAIKAALDPQGIMNPGAVVPPAP
jgi:FAD/FMN-containing dehydrogenase